MLQQQNKLQKDIERSLDRLRILAQQKSAIPTIPAFYYSANLLNNYAKLVGADAVKSNYFLLFKVLSEEFALQDFSQIKKNHQLIVDDILEIVDSQLFIDCTRPDIKSRRYTHQHVEGETSREEIILAKERYNFKLTDKEIHEALNNKDFLSNSPAKSVASIESQDYFINQFDQIWQSIERSYKEHNIDEAYFKAMDYVDKISKKTAIPNNRKQLIQTICLQYNTMTNFYQEFDKSGWILDKQEKGITLEYKIYEEEKQIAIRINGQFDIPAEPFLSIISEIDLMGDYVPFCYDCKQLKVISRNQKIGTSKIYIPLLTDRQTYFYASGYDRIKQKGSIFLFSKTINQDQVYQKRYNFKVPDKSDFVRLQYKFFIVEYIPLTKQRAKIRLASKIDMKLNFLPLFILNKSARIFAFDYFKNILDRTKNYKGSAWQQKVQEKPDMYNFFKKKIGQYFNNK